MAQLPIELILLRQLASGLAPMFVVDAAGDLLFVNEPAERLLGVRFAELARVRRLCLFHHDPSHDDGALDGLAAQARAMATSVDVIAGREGDRYDMAAHDGGAFAKG